MSVNQRQNSVIIWVLDSIKVVFILILILCWIWWVRLPKSAFYG